MPRRSDPAALPVSTAGGGVAWRRGAPAWAAGVALLLAGCATTAPRPPLDPQAQEQALRALPGFQLNGRNAVAAAGDECSTMSRPLVVAMASARVVPPAAASVMALLVSEE